ncbi:endodeoxyribonuclease [Kappamyces sp. JEL0829]|nr:endodeoxyribonuclease [Kappamyces sp. JEL0829]
MSVHIILATFDEIFCEQLQKSCLWILGRITQVLAEIQEHKGCKLKIINRAASGLVYVHSVSVLDPNNVRWKLVASSGGSFEVYVAVLQKIRSLLLEGTTVTKRDIFYGNVNLFKSQSRVDAAVEDIAASLGVERFQLNIIASSKGLVAGAITFHLKNGKSVSASQAAILIPDAGQIESIDVSTIANALVIEKDATFQALLDSNFVMQHPHTLLVTGKGFPDCCTRSLLVALAKIPASQTVSLPALCPISSFESLIAPDVDCLSEPDFWNDTEPETLIWRPQSQELSDDVCFQEFWSPAQDNVTMGMPQPGTERCGASGTPGLWQTAADVLVPRPPGPITIDIMVDADPDGLEIMLVYKHGSKALASQAAGLACPAITWKGVRVSRLDYCNDALLSQLIALSRRDRLKLAQLLTQARVIENQPLRHFL